MNPVNVNPSPDYSTGEGSRTAVANNLTWAISVVLINEAIAVAVVYVFHNVHP